ncbi:MAG TPA: hypothetical protein VMG31_01245 [Verrucomicrobiae bacterium]|nr:hypothetical protein [Verrucomicrobiae bacterium]
MPDAVSSIVVPRAGLKRPRISEESVSGAILTLAGAFWIFNIAWFWHYCGRNINADAISYIGIARHLRAGDFLRALHGYWSPLISWLMAPVFVVSGDRTLAARLLMFPLFAASLALLYLLTAKLWKSKLLSACAVLWFVMARGIALFSFSFIGADLLLTATVLIYFIQLLRCLENPENSRSWIGLGLAHAIAFLAKAIAMPLFAMATVVAALWSLGRRPKRAFTAVVCAAMLPVFVWAGWGMALRAKYGVFTSGYQLHWNLLSPEVKQTEAGNDGMLALRDTRKSYDAYMISDSMPPGSPLWHAKVWRAGFVNQILLRELQYIPSAGKELFVLLTPGGVLALLLAIVRITRERSRFPSPFAFAWIVVLTTACLVAAYCMLIFDGRYVIPITPLLMALALGFFAREDTGRLTSNELTAGLKRIGGVRASVAILLIAGLIGVQVYWASPFRTIRQDAEECVYSAAGTLSNNSVKTVAVIGSGPNPRRGVGWEAGMYAAYFSGSRIVGSLYELPPASGDDSVDADLTRLSPDAAMVWGTPSDPAYSSLVQRLHETHDSAVQTRIEDGRQREVGTVLLLRKEAAQE